MAELKLAREPKYGNIGMLGESTSVDQGWLSIQEVKFADDAVFASMCPLTGGAMVCDCNEVEHLGAPSKEQIDEVLCIGGGFNPAADTIQKMMEQ